MKQLTIPHLQLESYKGLSAIGFWGNKRNFVLNSSIYYLNVNTTLCNEDADKQLQEQNNIKQG